MVDISKRLILPQDAVKIKKAGIIQLSQYAWFSENGKEWMLLIDDEPDSEGNIPLCPRVKDWSTYEGASAAFDLTDIGLLLTPIGYYLSGKTFELSSLPRIVEQTYWADDIASITDFDKDVYEAYGEWEAAAKGKLLTVLLEKGKVPVNYPFYVTNKIEEVCKLFNKKSYGISDPTSLQDGIDQW